MINKTTTLQKPIVKNKEVNQNVLHWNVKHNTNFKDEDDFLEIILMECGVKREDIPSFLHPQRKFIHDPFLMKNMDYAVELVHRHIEAKNQIVILPDNDNDGQCSAAIMGQFLSKDLTQEIPEIKYLFSDGKSHGLTYDLVKNFKKKDKVLVIVPDASTTCGEIINIQRNFPNMDVLILDHHRIEDEYFDTVTGKWIIKKEAEELREKDPERIKVDCYTNYVRAVNCTDGEYPNPALSGGGVVQKFVEAYYSKYKDECVDDCIYKYLDLVSLAISGDGMSLIPLENRYYVLEGMKNAHSHNGFFNELQDRLAEDMKFGRYITSATWTLVPKVNGVIRFGKPKEKEDMFRAILGEQRDIEYQPRRVHKDDPKPPVEIHTLQWDAARTAVNIKARQDNEVRKYMKVLDAKIQAENLDENSVLFVNGDEVLEKSTVSGLIANKLASQYHRPVVILKTFDDTSWGGSGRGYDKGSVKDFNKLLSSVGVSCMGHSNAFGIRFNKEELPSIIKSINEKLPLESLQVIHDVDWEIPARQLKKEYVSEVAQNYELWGNDVPEPTFAISNLKISATEINGYGEFNNFIRFTYNGIPFVKKYCSKEDYPRMICQSKIGFGKPKHIVKLNIIGQFVLSSYDDKVVPQVKILYFDSCIEGKDLEDKEIKTNKEENGFKPLTSNIGDDNIKNEKSSVMSKGKAKKVAFDLDDLDDDWEFNGKSKKTETSKTNKFDDDDFEF